MDREEVIICSVSSEESFVMSRLLLPVQILFFSVLGSQKPFAVPQGSPRPTSLGSHPLIPTGGQRNEGVKEVLTH